MVQIQHQIKLAMATNLKIYSIIALSWLTLTLQAQIEMPKAFETEKLTTSLNVSGQFKNGTIRLKWLPAQYEILRLGQKYGFKIERAEYTISLKEQYAKYNFSEQKIVNPWNTKMLEEYFKNNPNFIGSKDYEHLALAYELTIGSDTTADIRIQNSILENKEKFNKALNEQNYNYMLSIIVACFSNIAAEAIGIYYEEKDVKSNVKYVYKVSLLKNDSKFILNPEYIILENKNESKEEIKIKIKEGDKNVSLLWNKSNKFIAYEAYYSADGGIKFTKASKVPILNNTINGYEGDQFSVFSKDSLVNYKEYSFIINGLNIFGESVEIGRAKGTPRDLTPPERPILNKVSHISPNTARIEWSQLADSTDVFGYKIYRSNSNTGKYYIIHDSIIPAKWRSFKDNYFFKDTSNYYIVSALDKYGNQSYSDPLYLTLIDTTPPKIPVLISGKMDSLGIVTINLEAQKEKDFMGYRVFKANAPDHEFSVDHETFNDTIVSNAKRPIIKDTTTLKTLTKFIYYKITALDFHYNESRHSEIIKIKRIDTIAPVAPVILDFKINEDGVLILYEPSNSEDVLRHHIYKKSQEKKEIEKILITNFDNKVLDTLVQEGKKYEYWITATDDSGLESKASNALIGGGLVLPKDIIQNFKVDQNENIVKISWEYKNSSAVPSIALIYRSEMNSKFLRLTKINYPISEFIDTDVKKGVSYSYKIVPEGNGYDYKVSNIIETNLK